MAVVFADSFAAISYQSNTNTSQFTKFIHPSQYWTEQTYVQLGDLGSSVGTPFTDGEDIGRVSLTSSTNSYIRKPLNNSDTFSVGFGASLPEASGYDTKTMYGVTDASNNWIAGVFRTAGGNVGLRVNSTEFEVTYIPWTINGYTAAQWFHFEITFNSATNVWNLYVNAYANPVATITEAPSATPTKFQARRTTGTNTMYMANYVEGDTATQHGWFAAKNMANFTVEQSTGLSGSTSAATLEYNLVSLRVASSDYCTIEGSNSELIFRTTVPSGTVAYNWGFVVYAPVLAPYTLQFREGETTANLVSSDVPALTLTTDTAIHASFTVAEATQIGNQTDGNGEYHLFGLGFDPNSF